MNTCFFLQWIAVVLHEKKSQYGSLILYVLTHIDINCTQTISQVTMAWYEVIKECDTTVWNIKALTMSNKSTSCSIYYSKFPHFLTKIWLTHWPLVMLIVSRVMTGSDNGLVPGGTKPLPEPMLTSLIISLIARFMGPTWGPPGSCRPQVGPM